MNDETKYVPPACRHEPEWDPDEPPPSYNPMSRIEFERLFGGRVLAWIGGLATLLGIVFLLRSAVDSSWFTEEIRTLLAAFGSLVLLRRRRLAARKEGAPRGRPRGGRHRDPRLICDRRSSPPRSMS